MTDTYGALYFVSLLPTCSRLELLLTDTPSASLTLSLLVFYDASSCSKALLKPYAAVSTFVMMWPYLGGQ